MKASRAGSSRAAWSRSRGCLLIGVAAIGSGSRSGIGVVLCIVAACAYAVAVVVQKPVLARVSPFQVTFVGCAAATIACLPFAPNLVADAAKAGAGAIGWTVYLGAGPTALGFATWAIALKRTTAGRMASLTYLIPLVAIVLGWLILGETPPLLAVAGGIACLVGVLVARRRRQGERRLWTLQRHGTAAHGDAPREGRAGHGVEHVGTGRSGDGLP